MLLSSIFVYGGEIMDLGQLIRQVIRDNEDDPQGLDAKDWINRALDDLSPIAKMQDHKYAAKIDSHTYEVPEGCRKINGIFADDEELDKVSLKNRYSSGYRLWGNEITIQNVNDYLKVDIYYERNLKRLENDEDIPEIEPEFHDLLVLYATAMYQYMDDELGRENDALNRYYRRKDEYKAFKRVSEVSHDIKDVYV